MPTCSEIITDIIEKVEIDRNFAIRHPDYPPLEQPAETIARFQRTPPQLQTKYLTVQVQSYLYDIYFTHSLMSLQQLETKAQQPLVVQNNVVDGIDIEFHQRLQQGNTSNGYFDPDWQVVAVADHNELIVVKDGLNIHIDRSHHLAKDFKRATIGDIVPIYLPHNLAGQDSYMMVGNFGLPDRANSVELYLNFTPDAAVAIAPNLTRALNKLGIPFQFAILHNPDLFHRADAGILSLPQAGYVAAQTALAEIYRSHQADFSSQVPLFTKQLAPGLGLAEVPTTSNFGMQRCELLATGLLTALEQDRNSTNDRLNTIHQHFATAEVDLHQPYLNPLAVDLYSSLVAGQA
jgi:HopA1 effector protein family